MLNKSTLEKLTSSKNLLAFSAGGDSTALLFLLLQNKINFDIAIVDYGLRTQSKKEVSYAKELAKKHNFKCFTHEAKLIDSNFESEARRVRYNFFEELINKHHYQNILTAHHLGDRFEWMLMQFCKGAGCVELSGMQEVEKRNSHTLLRPLLHLEKQELLKYLQTNAIYYFEDESNSDEKYKRNYFRKHHTNPLLERHADGIKKSFKYIDADKKSLIINADVIEEGEFAYFKTTNSSRSNIFHIDKYLKSKGFLISAKERELLHLKSTLVIARKIVVNQTEKFVFIAPYVLGKSMTKEFKEEMRLHKIEPKLRAYIYTHTKVKKLIFSLFLPSL